MGGPDKESFIGERGVSLYRRPSQFFGNRDQSEAGIFDKEEGEKLIQSKGKWTVAYVSTYEKNAFNFKSGSGSDCQRNLNVERFCLLCQRTTSSGGAYKSGWGLQVMFHEFPFGRRRHLKCKGSYL